MPHLKLKKLKLNIDKHAATILAYAEGLARRYAEEKIAEFIDYLRKQCPPQEVIVEMLKTTSTIRKTVGKASKRGQKIKKLSDKLKIALDAVDIAIEIITHFNIPKTFGAWAGLSGPFGPPFMWNIPEIIETYRNAKLQWLIDARDKIEEENDNINDILRDFEIVFVPLLAKIELVDAILNRCLQNPNISVEERFASIPEDTDTSTNKDEPFTNLNGTPYTIKVITDPNSPSIAPQRRAIAIDKRGVTVLKGPLSFASESKVLIEELKFRINNQLP